MTWGEKGEKESFLSVVGQRLDCLSKLFVFENNAQLRSEYWKINMSDVSFLVGKRRSTDPGRVNVIIFETVISYKNSKCIRQKNAARVIDFSPNYKVRQGTLSSQYNSRKTPVAENQFNHTN